MPQSRNRHKHHHPMPAHHTPVKAKRSAAVVVAVVAAILGLAVAFFTGAGFLWMIVSAASGAVVGYLAGRSMDKSIAKS